MSNKDTTSADYLSKSVGWCVYFPLIIGSLILGPLVIFSDQPLWMTVLVPSLLVISVVCFWLSRNTLWQFLFAHGILSIALALYSICCIFISYEQLNVYRLFQTIFVISVCLGIARTMFTASKRHREFISHWENI